MPKVHNVSDDLRQEARRSFSCQLPVSINDKLKSICARENMTSIALLCELIEARYQSLAAQPTP